MLGKSFSGVVYLMLLYDTMLVSTTCCMIYCCSSVCGGQQVSYGYIVHTEAHRIADTNQHLRIMALVHVVFAFCTIVPQMRPTHTSVM